MVDKLTNRNKKEKKRKLSYEREVPDMSAVHHWGIFLFWGGFTEIRLHDLFSPG